MFAQKTCPSVALEDDDLRNAFWNQLYPGEMESQQNSDVSTVIHRRRH